jgi:outer membrane lipoprotein SlyB
MFSVKKSIQTALPWVLMALAVFAVSPVWSQTSTGYSAQAVQQPQSVSKATVVAVRDVTVAAPSGMNAGTAIGGSVGGALGAVLSSAITQRNANSANWAVAGAVTTLGATLGGVLGTRVASGGDQPAQEVIIRRPNGEMTAIVQNVTDGTRFKPGDEVMLIGNGRIAPLSL